MALLIIIKGMFLFFFDLGIPCLSQHPKKDLENVNFSILPVTIYTMKLFLHLTCLVILISLRTAYLVFSL